MKKAQSIEGRWHIHGEDKPAHYGTLICDPVTGLRLEVKELKSQHIDEMLSSAFSHTWRNEPLVIQGWDADNHPIRLFGCCDEGGSHKAGVRTHEFYVKHAITSLSAGTWRQLRSRRFRLYCSSLHNWMDRNYPKTLEMNRPSDIEIEVRAGFKVVLGAVVSSSSRAGGSFKIKHGSWIGLWFDEDQPVHSVRSNECTAIVLLLSLLMGTPVALDDFLFLPEGVDRGVTNERRLLEVRGYSSHPKEDKDKNFMRATYPAIADRASEIFKAWFLLFESPDMKAVLELYASVTYSDLYFNAEFLFLAQALEAYHTACGRFSGNALPDADFQAFRERVESSLSPGDFKLLRERFIFANQKSYLAKLEEIIQAAPKQARTIISEPATFAKVVKDLRNAYTHHVGLKAQKTRSEYDRMIPSLIEQARCLFEILLLAEARAPDGAFDDIVRQHTTAVTYDLRDGD